MKKKNLLTRFFIAAKWAFLFAVIPGLIPSCKDYDDDISRLQDQIDANTGDLADLLALTKAGKFVQKVENTATGIKITFSDGTVSSINNGADGAAGASTVIEITNGYWYINGANTGVKAEGTDGTNGTNGLNGANGTDGKDGATPTVGTDGYWWVGGQNTGIKATGETGATGATGAQGATGATGAQGAAGAAGAAGATGATGAAGKDGLNGINGTNGLNGANGATPVIGLDGYWWINGQNTGVSAAGAQGPQGETGSQGETGAAGADGATPLIGSNGNWWIGTEDTGISAQGAQGVAGADGAAGQTPYVGLNGNWFLGEVDLGVKAAGIDGAPGSQVTIVGGEWYIDGVATGISANPGVVAVESTDGDYYTISVVNADGTPGASISIPVATERISSLFFIPEYVTMSQTPVIYVPSLKVLKNDPLIASNANSVDTIVPITTDFSYVINPVGVQRTNFDIVGLDEATTTVVSGISKRKASSAGTLITDAVSELSYSGGFLTLAPVAGKLTNNRSYSLVLRNRLDSATNATSYVYSNYVVAKVQALNAKKITVATAVDSTRFNSPADYKFTYVTDGSNATFTPEVAYTSPDASAVKVAVGNLFPYRLVFTKLAASAYAPNEYFTVEQVGDYSVKVTANSSLASLQTAKIQVKLYVAGMNRNLVVDTINVKADFGSVGDPNDSILVNNLQYATAPGIVLGRKATAGTPIKVFTYDTEDVILKFGIPADSFKAYVAGKNYVTVTDQYYYWKTTAPNANTWQLDADKPIVFKVMADTLDIASTCTLNLVKETVAGKKFMVKRKFEYKTPAGVIKLKQILMYTYVTSNPVVTMVPQDYFWEASNMVVRGENVAGSWTMKGDLRNGFKPGVTGFVVTAPTLAGDSAMLVDSFQFIPQNMRNYGSIAGSVISLVPAGDPLVLAATDTFINLGTIVKVLPKFWLYNGVDTLPRLTNAQFNVKFESPISISAGSEISFFETDSGNVYSPWDGLRIKDYYTQDTITTAKFPVYINNGAGITLNTDPGESRLSIDWTVTHMPRTNKNPYGVGMIDWLVSGGVEGGANLGTDMVKSLGVTITTKWGQKIVTPGALNIRVKKTLVTP